MKQCKDNGNEDQFIPLGVKINIKLMAMEQGLYAQVVMLLRKDLEFIAANKNKLKLNSSSKVDIQDHSVVLILNLIGLK